VIRSVLISVLLLSFSAFSGSAQADEFDDVPRPGQNGELKSAIKDTVKAKQKHWGSEFKTARRWFDDEAVGGHEIKLLSDGKTLHRQRLSMIAQAKRSIYVSAFSFKPDNTGSEIISALCMKAREGLDVRLMTDAFGSPKLRDDRLAIRDCGIKFMVYNPTQWGVEKYWYNLHEKLFIVDGRTVLTGGSGFSDLYLKASSTSNAWYDLDVRIDGPAACLLHDVYIENWKLSQREDELSYSRDALDPSEMSAELKEHLYGDGRFTACSAEPLSPPAGKSRVATVYNNPRFSDKRPILAKYIAAGMFAKKKIKIYAPYIVPHKDFIILLELAVLHGVDVSIITNSRRSSDERAVVVYAVYKNAVELISRGVKVYMWSGTSTMHRKAGIYDGLAFIGTDNQDIRGQKYSSEDVVFTDDPKIVSELERQFDADLKNCQRLTLKQAKKMRGLYSGFTRWLSDLLEEFM